MSTPSPDQVSSPLFKKNEIIHYSKEGNIGLASIIIIHHSRPRPTYTLRFKDGRELLADEMYISATPKTDIASVPTSTSDFMEDSKVLSPAVLKRLQSPDPIDPIATSFVHWHKCLNHLSTTFMF